MLNFDLKIAKITGLLVIFGSIVLTILIYLIGRGSEKDEKLLNFKISSYKLKPYIKHIKYINADSLLILKNLDLYFSLTRDFEGFGYSIAESLYMNDDE